MINRRFIALAVALLLCFSAVGCVSADTFNGAFNIDLAVGESFVWQDISEAVNVTFSVMSGSWNCSAVMNCTDAGGRLVFTSASIGSLLVSSSSVDTKITFNGVTVYSPQNFSSGVVYTVVWVYGAAPTAAPVTTSDSGLPQINTDWLWIYLYSGDVLGFFQALFLSAVGSLDVLFGLIILLFLVPLYIRTKSLLLVCIVWILLGSIFVSVIPVVSGLGVVFLALGIGGLLYRLFRGGNQ